ncbi:hypothetical protein MMC08_007499 [Hypocenomyce scalaris]|nr:hypothetical protein [Hypocenomyce scalaris]
MEVQILDAQYIDMGKLLQFLKEKFGEDDFEVESEDQGEKLRVTAPRILTEYGILAAERLDPNMLLFSRRSDRSLDLNHPPEHSHVRTASDENMIPTSQAAVPCDTRGVSDLAEACRYLAQNPDPIDWISEPLDLEHGEGSVTSLETTSDFRAFGGSSDESMR